MNKYVQFPSGLIISLDNVEKIYADIDRIRIQYSNGRDQCIVIQTKYIDQTLITIGNFLSNDSKMCTIMFPENKD